MGYRAVVGGVVGGELLAGAGGVGATFVVGSRVAGYRLEGQVGAGGMAVVFRARDELLGRPVALKIMAPALAADEVFRQRFIREWRAAAAVDDPHIIPVYEAGEADGVLFLSMRLVAGGDVRSLMQRQGPLSPAQAAAIISPVASALDATHGVGLVHRDVKPANMLLDRRPGRPAHVYLSDFGLSKSALSSAGLTGAGHFLGTPNYMAPEQIQGLPADGRTDQYALACVAFELLTGAPPFQRDQGMAVIWAHLQEPSPALSSRRLGLRTAADQVLATALAKTPQDRYANCGDFAEALRAALGLAPYHLQPDAAAHPATGIAWPDGPQPTNTAIPAPAAATGTTDPYPTTAERAADIAPPSAITSRRKAPSLAPPASHIRRRPPPGRRRLTMAALTGVCLAVLSVAVIVLAGALQANSAAGFNRRVGWATVLAVLIAAVGVLLLVDKIAGNTVLPELSAAEAEDELAAVVLSQAEVQRSRLIGIEEASDEAVNVRFVKRMGTFRSVGGSGEGNLASVSGYYQSLSPKRLVVLGDPGAGKTVLALELLIQLLERRRLDRNIPIPVLVSAAACDTNVPWDKWLTKYLAQQFRMATYVMGNLVRDGRVLPIVDGLDEMDPPGAPRRANALIAALNSYMRGRERAAVVVTCRRAEYQATRKVDRATHVEMVPLTSHEAAAYLSKEFLSEMERNSWEPVLADLRDNPKGLLASQLTTPWRLTLALAVFRANGDPAELLPEPVPTPSGPAAVRYDRRVDALLLGRYIRAKVNLNGRDLGYTPQKVERWLTALALGLDWQGHHNGSATDIHLDQLWRPAGPRMVPLAHIAVVAIIALPWAAFAAMRSQPGLTVIGATILPLAALAAHSPTPHRLQIDQLSTRLGLPRLLLRFTAGLAAGLALGLTGRFANGLAAGLTLLLALGFTSGLVLGIEDHSPHAIGPRDVIQADRNFGLAAGLAFGLGGGLAGGLVGALARWLASRLGVGMLAEPGGLALGLAEGFTLGLAFGLAFGGASSVRYYLGVVVGALRGTRPMAFGTFLDWCCKAGLLRLSGIVYQFRHRQLQDWLMSTQYSKLAPRDSTDTASSSTGWSGSPVGHRYSATSGDRQRDA